MLKKFIQAHYDTILLLLNYLKIGVYITDGKGKTLLVNDESCKTGGLTRQEVMGRYMDDLEREGYVEESVTLRVLKSGKDEVMIQKLGEGGRIYCSAHPVYAGSEIDLVITTEKDTTEGHILQRLLKEQQDVTIKYEKELAYLRKMNLKEADSLIAIDENTSRCVAQAKRVAALDTTALITGESGVGKEVIANLIHKYSQRSEKPFIKINCSAIPESLMESEMFGYKAGAFTGAQAGGKIGYFELADGGSLFLDEIGDMPLQLQAKLLRAIQDKEIMPLGGTKSVHVDVRLIAATNKDIIEAMNAGAFRKDLYYRLAVMLIEIPPLRERGADIAHLAMHFIAYFNKKYGYRKSLEPGALDILKQHNWPGNVRELQNIIERCVISFDGDSITAFQVMQVIRMPDTQSQISPALPAQPLAEEGTTMKEIMSAYEKQVVLSALRQSKNASEASRRLGIDRSTMSRYMKKHNIHT